jgi:hypothetical protein
MTRLTSDSRVWSETCAVAQRTPLVIELRAHTAYLRLKGARWGYEVDYHSIWLMGAKKTVKQALIERQKRRKEQMRRRYGHPKPPLNVGAWHMRARNWSRMAERHNTALEAKAPLFASAGLITLVTADEIKDSYERWQRDRERLRLRQVRFAERCRRLVARRVSTSELDDLDTRRSRLPPSSEYGADFWRRVLARLCGRPKQEHQTC